MDVLVLNYNNWEETKAFVESIIGFESVNHILVVDNCSTNNSYLELVKLQSSKVLVVKTAKNGGYGYGNNYGVNFLKEKFGTNIVAICNPDIVIDEQALIACETFLISNKEFSIVAPWMQDTDKKDSKCGWLIGSWKKVLFGQLLLLGKKHGLKYVQKSNNKCVSCDAVAGSLLFVNVDDFLNSGGYDEKVFLYSEESILGLRMKAIGKKTALLCDYSFIHKGSTTISKELKTSFARHKMILKSQKYMFKTYYKLNIFDRFGIWFFSNLILLETLSTNFFYLFKHRKKTA